MEIKCGYTHKCVRQTDENVDVAEAFLFVSNVILKIHVSVLPVFLIFSFFFFFFYPSDQSQSCISRKRGRAARLAPLTDRRQRCGVASAGNIQSTMSQTRESSRRHTHTHMHFQRRLIHHISTDRKWIQVNLSVAGTHRSSLRWPR